MIPALFWTAALIALSSVLGLTIGPWLFRKSCGACAAAEGSRTLVCAAHSRRVRR